MEEEIIEEILKECNISRGLAILLVHICSDNKVKNIKTEIISFLKEC